MNFLTLGNLCSLLVGTSVLSADEKFLDFWDEEIRSIASAPAGKNLDHRLERQRHPNYFYHWTPKEFKLDHSDSQVGDFSLLYLPGKSAHAAKVGFLGNLWGGEWTLSEEMTLKFELKTTGSGNPEKWRVVLVDTDGNKAGAVLEGTNTEGAWRELSLPLKDLEAGDPFDWSAVRLVEFEASFEADAEIRFDGVRFEGAGQVLGVTDKTVAQRMEEDEATREFRVKHAFGLAPEIKRHKGVAAFGQFFMNEDLDLANRLLSEDLEAAAIEKDHWNLIRTPLYLRTYYFFSNRVGKYPGRLDPEVEKLLLEAIWQRTVVKNDIAWAKKSTWWMDGSENHDLNAKVSNLVSARIFMNEPDYQDRIYPDHGYGGAYHYGRSGYYGKGVDASERHGGGRANLKDGADYNAADHYEAWAEFLKEYFRERAKRGFFLENSASGYTRFTLNYVDLAGEYGGDAELSKLVADFRALYWADWAQKATSGIHGGPKTRHHGVGGYDSTTHLMRTLLGGAGSADQGYYWALLSNFRLPEIVWSMALDRKGMGEFAYRSRGIGEEENVRPRPAGTERTLLVDTDSRILKYTYITPDYILGSQMDHPGLTHSHLSTSSRWQGLTTSQSVDARIANVTYPESARSLPDEKKKPSTTTLMRNAQYKNVLISHPARNFYRINPNWFPASGQLDQEALVVAIYIGAEWDERIEENGWVFLREGNAYAAVRPVVWDREYEVEKAKGETAGAQIFFNSFEADATVKLLEESYRWSTDGTYMELESRYSPVIIQAGLEENDGSFEAFIETIKSNPLFLYKTVVPGYNVLVYSPFGVENEEIVFNAATMEVPTIDGVPINYAHEKTFDSPYLQSDYKSGVIHMKFKDEALTLDFTQVP